MITQYLVEIYPDRTVETVSVKYTLLMSQFTFIASSSNFSFGYREIEADS